MKNVQRVLALVLGILLLCSSAYAMPPSAAEETKIILPSAEPEQTAEPGERLLLPESEESFAEDTADTHTEAELSNAPKTEQIPAEKSETLTVLQQRAEHDGISLREAQKILLTEKRDAKRAAYEEAYQLSEIPAMPEAAAAFSEEAATAANETTSNTNSMLSRVACGDAFYIFLKDDGTVVTWGLYNDTSYNITPYDVPEYTTPTQVANLSSVVSVAADREWGFALTSNGEVWRWTGRLTIEEHNEMPSAVRVDGLTDVASIAGGAGGLTALKKDGTVWYAARNTENGELDTPEPVQDASGMPLSGIIEISSGEEHSLALAGDGTVYAWGDNFYGQLGDGTRESRDYAAPIRNYTGAEKIAKVTAAEGYNLLEDEAGVRWTFGKSDDIEGIAYPKHLWMAQPLAEEEIAETFPPVGIKEIARYSHLGLVLGTDGSVWQKGTYTYTLQEEDPEYYPPGMYFMYVYIHDSDWTRTEGLSGTIEIPKTPALTIAASAFNNSQSLAVVNGFLMSAGDNNWGQLGDGTNTASSFPEFVVDYQDYQMDDVKKVSSGYGFNLILTEDGRVWSVGCADNGKLGIGETEHTNKVYPVRGKNGNGFLRDFVDISAGYKHGIAVKKDGSLWAWGHNSVGQLGDDSKVSTNVPVRVKGANGEDWMKNVVSAYANASTSMALKSDGTVYMWGNNDKGQLGDGTKTNRKTPVQVKGENGQGYIGNIKQIATAEGCSLALSTDGTVWSWGDNQNGRLGDGTTNNRYYPSKVLKADGSVLDHIESISVGYYFCAAVDEQGAVWTWGRNDYGQLGHGDTEDSYYADPVYEEGKVGRLYGVTAISCGRNYILMSRGADGSILASGYNQYGQFGNGRTGEQTVYPVEAFDSEIVKDVLWLREYMHNYGYIGTWTDKITLPAEAPNGSKIRWSSNSHYIQTNGQVNHPDCYGKDTKVTLTAEISRDALSYEETFSSTVAQDTTIQPSKALPVRSLGFEYDQTEDVPLGITSPEISGITIKNINKEQGIYELYFQDSQITHEEGAEPFFFWSSRDGVFLPVEGDETYRRVRFTVDEDKLDRSAKIVVGMGDGLGYIDKASFQIRRTGTVQTYQAAPNLISQAMEQTLNDTPISASLEAAVGIDISQSMLQFDSGDTKGWMSSAEGLLEGLPEDSVVHLTAADGTQSLALDKTAGLTALEQLKPQPYQGNCTALELLERTSETLSPNGEGNQLLVLFVQEIEDSAAVEEKIHALAQEGIAVYIMVLGGSYSGGHPNVHSCDSVLALRLAMSELYGALYTIGQAQPMLAETRAQTVGQTTDFKTGWHNFQTGGGGNAFGKSLSSLLNIYGCLPVMTDSYNLLDSVAPAELYQLMRGRAGGVTGGMDGVFDFYEGMKGLFASKWETADVEQVIEENLKYRFPVLVKDSSDNISIITGKSGGSYTKYSYGNEAGEITGVLDMYGYLTAIHNNSVNITSDPPENVIPYQIIQILHPYNKNIELREYAVDNQGTPWGYVSTLPFEDTYVNNGRYARYNTSALADKTILMGGLNVSYGTKADKTLPDIYNASKLFRVLHYQDLHNNSEGSWYYPYLQTATNLGIINGDEAANFNPGNPVTRAEAFKMILEAGKVDLSGSGVVNDAEFWARTYIDYMKNNVGIYGTINIDNAYFYQEMPREEIAYVIAEVFLNHTEDLRTAASLFDVPDGTACMQNAKWNSGTAFTDQWGISQSYKEAVRQLYFNNVMVGSLEADGTVQYKPAASVKRSEICKVIVKCLFDLDETVKTIRTVTEGDSRPVYIVLYDSEYVMDTGEKVDRYLNANGGKFEYSEAFFVNYFRMLKDAEVEFALSIRELDYDIEPNRLANATGDSTALTSDQVNGERRKILVDKTAEYVLKIVNHMYGAYRSLPASERPRIFPKVYIGTPHFDGSKWGEEAALLAMDGENQQARAIQDEFAALYRDTFAQIYQKITMQNQVISPSGNYYAPVNTEDIAGIYYGKEDPMFDIRVGEGEDWIVEPDITSLWYKTMETMSRFIHEKGKKLMWVPYTAGMKNNLRRIGHIANSAVYTDAAGREHNFCDIVIIQPGYFYSEVSPKGDYMPIIQDIHDSTVNGAVTVDGEIIGERIPAGTLITFEMEYDASLITGRSTGRDEIFKSMPSQKAERFLYTYHQFWDLISGGYSFGIYAGGPNEQGFDTLDLSHRHSSKNHNTLDFDYTIGVDENHNRAYTDFAGLHDVNQPYGKLLYDITYMLIYSVYLGNMPALSAFLSY